MLVELWWLHIDLIFVLCFYGPDVKLDQWCVQLVNKAYRSVNNAYHIYMKWRMLLTTRP